jgi:hyperosmotically inducible periplasmic protein
MKQTRAIILALFTGITLVTTGCSIFRGQEGVGQYADDKAITAAIKAKMIEDKTVDAPSITVNTLRGEVELSGFAKSANEKMRAESIARNTRGVRLVHDNIIVRP